MANAVTVLSEGTLETVRRLDRDLRVELVPNPVSLDPAPVPVAKTEEVVLFAGEVGLRKGVDVLVRAWEEVARERPTARCVVVGPPTSFKLPAVDRLEVHGPVGRATMTQLIRQARVVALPSRGEGLPMFLTEAMAVGRPFVSTPVGGIPSIAAGGVLVPVDNHNALARAIEVFLADAAHAEAVGTIGRALCHERMSPEVIAARLRQLYAYR